MNNIRLYGQSKRVYDLLKTRATKGITSQELRGFTAIVDVPKTISNLRDKGIQITSKPERLGHSFIKRYFLSQEESEIVGYEYHGNVATPIYKKTGGE